MWFHFQKRTSLETQAFENYIINAIPLKKFICQRHLSKIMLIEALKWRVFRTFYKPNGKFSFREFFLWNWFLKVRML